MSIARKNLIHKNAPNNYLTFWGHYQIHDFFKAVVF
jgi:hypothetical protein